MMLRDSLLLPALLLLAPTLSADSLRPERIPEGTSWVAHMDVTRLAETKLWAQVQQLELEDGESIQTTFLFDEFIGDSDMPAATKAKLAGLEFDLFRDLRSITVAGTEGEVEDNVAILDMSGFPRELLDALQGTPGYGQELRDGLELHTFADPDSNQVEGACFLHRNQSERGGYVAILAKDRNKVIRTARVLRGESPALRRDFKSNLALNPDPGSIFFFEARGTLPGLDDIDEASVVTKLAKSIRVDFGEQDGYLEARIRVGTEDATKATQISQMLQGLVAMASLAGGSDPEMEPLSRLTSGLSFETNGPDFIIEFEFEVFELLQMAREMDKH